VQRIEAGDRVGCVIAAEDATWLVLLRKDSTRSSLPVAFTVPGAARSRILLTDLAAGRWEARRAGAVATFEVAVDSGAGWFEGGAGEWTVAPAAARAR
jgi:hypothetical protein